MKAWLLAILLPFAALPHAEAAAHAASPSLAASPAPAETFNHRPIQKYVKSMLDGSPLQRAQVADEALDVMLREAQHQLWRAGYPDLSERLKSEWEGGYKGSLERFYDEGDHDPLSAWLAVWYMAIDAALGETAMQMTHLVDIKTFNFAIPVVFRPYAAAKWCGEQLADHPEDTCEAEYRRHFAGTKYIKPDPYAEDPLHHGLAGLTAYWITLAACEAAVWGTDITLVCGLAGDLCEMGIDKFAAPKISDRIWSRNNH